MRQLRGLLFAVVVGCGTTPAGDVPAVDTDAPGVAGSCAYVNPFSQGDECKEYVGAGWTAADASADCAAPLAGAAPGTFSEGTPCDRTDILGECRVASGDPGAYTIVSAGTDPADCGGVSIGCGFLQGEAVPSDVCADGGGGGGSSTASVFPTFELVCMDPVDGEPAGEGPDGQVCTWGAISACTEEGRKFEDYASCDIVRRQRPYWAASVTYDTPSDDPRLADAAYLTELDWVTEQVHACGCICCHSNLAPKGSSGWTVDAGRLWVDTIPDEGLGVLGGWVDSSAFGAFPAEDNHGFDRSTTGIPTTDIDRMRTFLLGEVQRRGLTVDDFADVAPFGGPLYDQLHYVPGPCKGGEGVAADGTVSWAVGAIRYLYVLEQGSTMPGVPPNLDLPAGTIWRLDVAPTDPAIDGVVRYGVVPEGARQRFPTSGTPASLVPGRTYVIVALADVYQPLTRCTFTAP